MRRRRYVHSIRRVAQTLAAGLGLLAVAVLAAPLGGVVAQTAAYDLCGPSEPGVNCGPGGGRTSPGGGGKKVPHNDGAGRNWPPVTGILWHVLDGGGRNKAGGPANDELLGHHGSDKLSGKGGHDILWGDWDPKGNTPRQRDVLDGGAGNDWLYPSHGRSIVKGGAGSDYVHAYYGKGTIDCGPGRDTARVRTNRAFKIRGCERIKHFCAHGEDGKGHCLSPSGKPVLTSRRL